MGEGKWQPLLVIRRTKQKNENPEKVVVRGRGENILFLISNKLCSWETVGKFLLPVDLPSISLLTDWRENFMYPFVHSRTHRFPTKALNSQIFFSTSAKAQQQLDYLNSSTVPEKQLRNYHSSRDFKGSCLMNSCSFPWKMTPASVSNRKGSAPQLGSLNLQYLPYQVDMSWV